MQEGSDETTSTYIPSVLVDKVAEVSVKFRRVPVILLPVDLHLDRRTDQ